ncbi:unnamed protein product [Acanthosepion pharaonis]|uniref:Uncharacterized protein n=1 Tax=Acanthosepion pharaonis TaxID=158019 RepID=A0A812AVI2_ACAPH|nr:unnamed protein product [Sepia pharaonis]
MACCDADSCGALTWGYLRHGDSSSYRTRVHMDRQCVMRQEIRAEDGPSRWPRLVAFVLRYVGARTALTLWSNCAKTRSADSAKSSRGVALVIGAMICATDLGKCSSHKPRRTFSDTLCFPSWFLIYLRSWDGVLSPLVTFRSISWIISSSERPVRLRIASFNDRTVHARANRREDIRNFVHHIRWEFLHYIRESGSL